MQSDSESAQQQTFDVRGSFGAGLLEQAPATVQKKVRTIQSSCNQVNSHSSSSFGFELSLRLLWLWMLFFLGLADDRGIPFVHFQQRLACEMSAREVFVKCVLHCLWIETLPS